MTPRDELGEAEVSDTTTNYNEIIGMNVKRQTDAMWVIEDLLDIITAMSKTCEALAE